MKRLWLLMILMATPQGALGMTAHSRLAKASGSIEYVTTGSVSRAQSEVQIRRLKQLLISKKIEGGDATTAEQAVERINELKVSGE